VSKYMGMNTLLFVCFDEDLDFIRKSLSETSIALLGM
jgi:hypothetical protein